jgi:multiple sugar transport system ATP-binding protein
MGRAIVRKPQVFLMDEPLSNLDAKLRVQTRTQIASLQRRLGVTTVYVTHDQVEAMTMGDRVAVMKDGVLQQVDTPRNLYEKPNNLFVAGFIGSPSMNLLELTKVAGGVQFGNTVLPVSSAILSKAAGDTIFVGLRPENLDVTKKEGIEVNIDVIEELGADGYLYGTAQINGKSIDVVSRVDGRSHPMAGETVFLKAAGDAIVHLFDAVSGDRLN